MRKNVLKGVGFDPAPLAGRYPRFDLKEAQRGIGAIRTLSYRVFYFTLYSMGLRLSEGLALKVGDVDATRQRVPVRDSCSSNTSGYTTGRYPSTVDSKFFPCQKKYSSFWPPWPP